MKRELAFALEAQSQLTKSLGRTRSSRSQISNGSDRKNHESIDKDEGLNCSVDQNRVRIHTCNAVHALRRNKRLKTGGEFVIIEELEGESVTTSAEDEFKYEKTSFQRRFTRSALKLKGESLGLDNGSNCNHVECEGVQDLEKKSGLGKLHKRKKKKIEMKKSAGKDENLGLGTDNDCSNLESEAVNDLEKKSGLGKLHKRKKKIELNNNLGKEESLGLGNDVESAGANDLEKKSEHVKLRKRKKEKIEVKKYLPTTIEELLETGLLDGYPVSYKRDKKGNVLRGTIKDAGILCYCSLCKGSRVIKPSEFEVHARNIFRHEYICLENGKRLLQIVKACMKTSISALEETIQCSVEELAICQNCKVSGSSRLALNEERLCKSCVDSQSRIEPTVCSSINEAREKDMLLKPVPITDPSPATEVQKPSQGNMKQKTLLAAPEENRDQEMKEISSKLGESDKSATRSSLRILSQKKIEKKTNIKSLSKSRSVSTGKRDSKSRWKITKKDLKMHKLVFGENGLPEGTEVAYYTRGKKLLEGYKKGSGIFCRCCSTEVSASLFEAHAGCASRKKPYGYIYTSNGVSLHELAISLLKERKHSSIESDNICIICMEADGGDLLFCDGCPRAFHKECASLSAKPDGKWYCRYCEKMFGRQKFVAHNANALAAGRVSGAEVDPIQQIATCCIRIVKHPDEPQLIACVLCREYDYGKSGFGPRTVVLCDQCEKEYHVGCLKERNMADLEEMPKEAWFCCEDCQRINSELTNAINGGEEKIPESFLDVIKKKEIVGDSADINELDVRWTLLSGKNASSRETRSLLSQAVAIFHDRFDPIVDPVTQCDLIPTMVYGRNIRGQDFRRMYCAVLSVNSVVISAGLVRVFGAGKAELPLVATSGANQGKGYFQVLLSCIEKLLASLKVKSLVLPAAEIAESIWTDRFSFQKIPPQQLVEYRKEYWQLVSFKGTSMLEKQVPSCSTNQS